MAFCAVARGQETGKAERITDPQKIVNSTTYDLGDHRLTVEELTKEALPMPPPAPPTELRPSATPHRSLFRQQLGFLSLGSSVYRRNGQPTRSLITYRPPGKSSTIIFWSSADWSLLSGTGKLTDPDGKTWHLMLMLTSYDLDQNTAAFRKTPAPAIPEFSPGSTTCQIVSGNATVEDMAPIYLFQAYYDANLLALKAAWAKRMDDQKRLAAEEKANPPQPEDVFVQYRILSPEEIVSPERNPSAPEP